MIELRSICHVHWQRAYTSPIPSPQVLWWLENYFGSTLPKSAHSDTKVSYDQPLSASGTNDSTSVDGYSGSRGCILPYTHSKITPQILSFCLRRSDVLLLSTLIRSFPSPSHLHKNPSLASQRPRMPECSPPGLHGRHW